MNATTHFPRWTPEEFVVPEGWTDDSWRDDTMPKWVSPCGQYWLWVDYANPEDRENGQESERFCLVRALEDDPFGLFFTESFNEMVCFIKGLEMKIELNQQGFMDAETGELFPVYMIQTAHGEWIHDPYVSTCGRFCCTPQHHGLTDEKANELVRRNEESGFSWKCE